MSPPLTPGPSAAKRYSNMFRSRRSSHMFASANGSNEDVSAPSFFDDLAFLEETGGFVVSPTKVSKSRFRSLRKPKDSQKTKTHSSRPSTGSFLRRSGLKRTPSQAGGLDSPSSGFQSFIEEETSTIDIGESIREVASDDEHHAAPNGASAPSSDSESGGGGFFSEMAFLEAQETVAVKSPKVKTKKSGFGKTPTIKLNTSMSRGESSPRSSTSSFSARFRAGSSQNSVRSRNSSMRSVSTSAMISLASGPPRSSHTPSQNSGLPSSPPSLATECSSRSLSSTMISSPSVPSQGSVVNPSSPAQPNFTPNCAFVDSDTPRAAIVGRSHSYNSQLPLTGEPPSPQLRFLEPDVMQLSLESPLLQSPAAPRRPARQNTPPCPLLASRSPTGSVPSLNHHRQCSVVSATSPSTEHASTTTRPPRHSSLNSTAGSVPSAVLMADSLSRASLSAVTAREEIERYRSSGRRRSSGTSTSSSINPTAQDIALLPTFNPALNRFARSAAGAAPVSMTPPVSWGARRTKRTSVLTADGSPCLSLIASFPNPPSPDEVADRDEQWSPSQALAQVQQAQLWQHLPISSQSPHHLRPTSSSEHLRPISLESRPESDAFAFDDEYWLANPVPRPALPPGETSPSTPTLLTPDVSHLPLIASAPQMVGDASDSTFSKQSSTDSSVFDLNSLIEHARPESAILPDYASVRSMCFPSSEDEHGEILDGKQEVLKHSVSHGDVDKADDSSNSDYSDDDDGQSDEFEHDGEIGPGPSRSDTPTATAARADPFLALEAMASAAGYRLVREASAR